MKIVNEFGNAFWIRTNNSIIARGGEEAIIQETIRQFKIKYSETLTTEYLKQHGGFTKMILNVIGTEPKSILNGLNIETNEEWYAWNWLKNNIQTIRLKLTIKEV